MREKSIGDSDKKEYITINSPIGLLRITGSDRCIFEIAFVEKATQSSSKPPKEVYKCATQLKEYFASKRKAFNLTLKPVGTDFQQSVWSELCKFPFGKTTTYAKQAEKFGNRKAIRAIGATNGKNPIPIVIPCHRVIGSNGNLTGYAGGIDKKEWLLKHEGVILNRQMNLFL